jgi:hypothetical protein
MVQLPFITEEIWWAYDGERMPNSLDASWRSVIESFSNMNSGERNALRQKVTSLQLATLLIFAKRMASLAVPSR